MKKYEDKNIKNKVLAVLAVVFCLLMICFWTGKDENAVSTEDVKAAEDVSQKETEVLAHNAALKTIPFASCEHSTGGSPNSLVPTSYLVQMRAVSMASLNGERKPSACGRMNALKSASPCSLYISFRFIAAFHLFNEK